MFFVLSYYVSLRSENRDAMSITISARKRRSVRLYLQLFVGGLMSYLRHLCLFAHSDVQHILCYCIVLVHKLQITNQRTMGQIISIFTQ